MSDFGSNKRARQRILMPYSNVSPEMSLKDVLSHDPRPSYQKNSDRIYGLHFADLDVRFTVDEKTLTVCEVNQR